MKPIIEQISLEEIGGILAILAIMVGTWFNLEALWNASLMMIGILISVGIFRWLGLIGRITLKSGPRYFNWTQWILVILYLAFIMRFFWDSYHTNVNNLTSLLVLIFWGGIAIFIIKMMKGKGVDADERTRELSNKSARNALLVLLAVLLAGHDEGKTVFGDGTVIVHNPIDAEHVLIACIASFAVFLISMFIYHRTEFSTKDDVEK
jgi:uncharacterized membrane protein